MPDISHTLQEHDPGFLKIIANAWGIDLNAPDTTTAITQLVEVFQKRALVAEMIESLPQEAQAALTTLIISGGRMPWRQFCRRFGELRVIGVARRDRERPDLDPVSAVEALWYRGLIGKAFFNLPPEPQEYAYIPDDFMEFLKPRTLESPAPPGTPATAEQCAHLLPANDAILDHCCTLLAALRVGMDLTPEHVTGWRISPPTLTALLHAAGLVDEDDHPHAEAVRLHLQADRASALLQLVGAWLNAMDFNELRQMPGLVFEGEWRNDPLMARQAIINLLREVKSDTWWNLPAFIEGVHQRQPDFQRPAGDYDSWFIRRRESRDFLRGFESWYEVDGALVNYMICAPLHWLGILDLAAPDPASPPAAFRFSRWAASLLNGKPPAGLPAEDQLVKATSDGRLLLTNRTPRPVRYQMARFCAWEKPAKREYRYHISPASLSRAARQGLDPPQLVALLKKHAAAPLPPSLLQGLARWQRAGSEVHLKKAALLRVTDPGILEIIQKSNAARHLQEVLSPTAALVRPGAEAALQKTLGQLGYLVDSDLVI